jgi:cytochrome c biogenesis protein CcmG/thiol:disulfide interchange protein DsbE
MAVPEFYSGKILYPAIAVLLGLSTLFGLAILPRLVPGGGGLKGKPAPDFVFTVAANGGDEGPGPRAEGPGGVPSVGAAAKLSDFKGRTVLLDFWASWCGPCAFEAPIVDRLARRYQKRGLVVLGVNVDDPPEVIRRYAAQKGLSYPMVVDPAGRTSAQYGVDKLPSLVVIDKDGNVFAFLTGIVDEASLNEILSAAL